MKILVVDDESFVRMVIIRTLESAGYETAQCGDGETAIEMLTSENYGVVITDIFMPHHQSGISIGEFVKSHNIPTAVLAMSSDSWEADNVALDFANYFVDGTLQKPIDQETLLNTIASLSPGTNRDLALENM